MAVLNNYHGMFAGDLRFGVVLFQVNFRERAGLWIPAPDQVFAVLEWKFLAFAPATNQRKLGAKMSAHRGLVKDGRRGRFSGFDFACRRPRGCWCFGKR